MCYAIYVHHIVVRSIVIFWKESKFIYTRCFFNSLSIEKYKINNGIQQQSAVFINNLAGVLMQLKHWNIVTSFIEMSKVYIRFGLFIIHPYYLNKT